MRNEPCPPAGARARIRLSLLILVSACALSACFLSVQNAGEELPPDQGPILLTVSDRVWDSSAALREMLAASTRPKAVIQWLDNDSSWTGYQQGMLVDMEADWPDFSVHFRSPYQRFQAMPVELGGYRVGFLSLANDGDGDGRIFGMDGGFPNSARVIDTLPDSLETAYGRLVVSIEQRKDCPDQACRDSILAFLDSLATRLDSNAQEVGYRAARRASTPRDWYLGEMGHLWVVYIPDEYALGVANQRLQKECGSPNGFKLGYNFKPLKRAFPRIYTRFVRDSPSALAAYANLEDLRDRGDLAMDCGTFTGLPMGFTDRVFLTAPPEFIRVPEPPSP